MATEDDDVLKELFDKISKNDYNAVKSILSSNKLKPEVCDENGLTPLQHAAYKGNKEIVQLLLDQGAQVNSSKHGYGYTALHLAALSGNTDVCQLLLENGAKVHATNSVGRTPSQMAAFVGNHACVAVINNFVPKSDIEYYTVINGLETEPKLPPFLAEPLHKFVMQVSLNPVRIAMNLQKLLSLYDNIDKVRKVLELMSEREMKRGFKTNEIMAFKFHYLSCILADISKCKKKQLENNDDGDSKKIDPVEFFIKKMLKINKDSTPEHQEMFLKQCIMEFPNRECTILRQMVATLSRSDSPSALSVITSAINGQRGFIDSDNLICATCGEEKASKKCSKCKSVQYCDRDCQRHHWFVHKKFCDILSRSTNKNDTSDEKAKREAVNAATEALVSEINAMKVK
ncbi:UNVERIFIED_CONTAM: hypothetical protein PYX00_005426 [Menopon gallinae]|uniref:MYND-type domain-containing protein n=1 Tax=Menopon gallinae TaxID=328185 RepID=A0AAW2HRF1_9NEOP